MPSVIFFGSSAYSVIILKKLINLPGYTLSAVVTQPDKPFGRRQIITPNPVADFTQSLPLLASQSLPLLQPADFDASFITEFKKLKPDLALVVAYGPPFFTSPMLDIPAYGIINIHPSPLPRYRGAAPGPWQIINGETASAVTFFKIDEKPDHGPVITQIPFTIGPSETSESLYQKSFNLAADNLKTVLDNYLNHPQCLTPQEHHLKSYFPKLTKDQAQIDWTQPPAYIERFIRALLPWPVAWTYVLSSDRSRLRMKIFSSRLSPAGHLIPDQVQIENKKPSSWSQIKNYYTLATS